MPTVTEESQVADRPRGGTGWPSKAVLLLAVALAGCGGPSARELKNRQELEALLSAVSLKNLREVNNDAQRIARRHDSGELSEAAFAELDAIVERARGGDWAGAESLAYALRERRPDFP